MIPQAGRASLGAEAAAKLIEAGQAPKNLNVRGPLKLRGLPAGGLPEGLTAPSIRITCKTLIALPARLEARRIEVSAEALGNVGRGLRCDFLDLRDAAIETLPSDLQARQKIDLTNCRRLKSLPDNLTTGSLLLSGCVSLRELPRGLDVAFLDLAGCSSLRRLPDDLRMRGGHLNLRDCQWITRLPDDLGEISGLDLSGCVNLTRVPDGLKLASWIDIAGTGISALPPSLDKVGLRWRGIPVSRRIVFQPETLSAPEILGERNAELRRVMIERFGYERLMDGANAVEIDRDQDAGGERRLMRIALEGDEDVVCVSVQCPSTGHKFILRVPPTMQSCRQAIAWTAGYDDAAAYAPVQET